MIKRISVLCYQETHVQSEYKPLSHIFINDAVRRRMWFSSRGGIMHVHDWWRIFTISERRDLWLVFHCCYSTQGFNEISPTNGPICSVRENELPSHIICGLPLYCTEPARTKSIDRRVRSKLSTSLWNLKMLFNSVATSSTTYSGSE